MFYDASDHLANGNPSEARKFCDMAVETIPGDRNLQLTLLLGRCTGLIMEGRYLDAISDAFAVLRFDDAPALGGMLPGYSTFHSMAYFCLAKCYFELGQTEIHQIAFERHREIEERVAKAKANATGSSTNAPVDKMSVEQLKQDGNKYFQAGKYLQAAMTYHGGLILDPDNHILHSNICQAMLLDNNPRLAKYHAKRCVELKPSWPKGYYRLGMVLLRLGEYSEAVKVLEKASSLAKQQGMPYDAALANALKEARAKQATGKSTR
jgi:tetratricopeptide (TPR) repeat protein